MFSSDRDPDHLRRMTLVVLALGITAVFLWMILPFLTALFLAAILSGMFHPLYRRLGTRFRGRRRLAAACTMATALLVVIIPLSVLSGIVIQQAIGFGQLARPWVEQRLARGPEFDRLLENTPGLELLRPYRQQILAKLGEIAGGLSRYALDLAGAAARETVTFFVMAIVVLYAMFFFLIHGRRTLARMLYYLPLPSDDEERMIERFVSVARATIKGTIVIGIAQGALGGLGFWVAGLDGAALWGSLMAVLSAIPGLGHALVWIPAVAYLAIDGQWTACIGLTAWCGLAVGSVDNFLRPWLVGKDTKLPDLLILLSTLGGLLLFGAVGFILGPIVAALVVTIWDLYGAAFKDILPPAADPTPSIPMPPVRDDDRD